LCRRAATRDWRDGLPALGIGELLGVGRDVEVNLEPLLLRMEPRQHLVGVGFAVKQIAVMALWYSFSGSKT
jgi:hypothetical protein